MRTNHRNNEKDTVIFYLIIFYLVLKNNNLNKGYQAWEKETFDNTVRGCPITYGAYITPRQQSVIPGPYE